MLNYIKAEFYKVCCRKYFWVLLAVMIALESLFALAWVGPNEFTYLVAIMTTTMPIGSFLAVILADIVVSEPYKNRTLKNEISFGLTRGHIYLGKLFASILVAMTFCAILFGWYLGGCWLATQHTDLEAARVNLTILAYTSAASLPLWLGTLGLSVALYMTLKSETAGVLTVFGLLTVGVGLLSILAQLTLEPVARVVRFLLDWIPAVKIDQYQGPLTLQTMARNWHVGMTWLAGSTAVGLAVFRRREIK